MPTVHARSARRRSIPLVVLVAAQLALLPGAALAAPPANDDRAAAQSLGDLPASVSGTTVDATKEATDPDSGCAPAKGSVWYRFSASADRRIIVNLAAAGDLDAVVDVYLRQRSQVRPLSCDATNAKGQAALDFDARKGETYLIRVTQLANSVPGTFRLTVAAAAAPARPPGAPLPRRGAADRVDRVLNPSDAWATSLSAGRTYRIHLVSRGAGCPVLWLYPPGTTSFERGGAVRVLRCDGYALFTPRAGEGGRYSALVRAGGSRGAQRYRLQISPALADDTAPGRFIGNYARVRGSLDGRHVDVVDLFRFDVVRRSDLDLRLGAGGDAEFDLVLLDDRGRRVACACYASGDQALRRRLRPGRYFAAVRARGPSAGRYTLTRVSRAITSTRVTINGARSATSTPGASVRIGVDVAPRVPGPVTVVIERFDPLSGWQFARRIRVRSASGRAVIPFRPRSVGRWRVRASFDGTRTASPSETGFRRDARLLVADALRE